MPIETNNNINPNTGLAYSKEDLQIINDYANILKAKSSSFEYTELD